MLREQLNSSLKDALLSKKERAVCTIRLIIAAIKDRDIAARGDGNTDGIEDKEILSLLQSMVKQRHESIEMYERGCRLELAEREREEIDVINGFLPKQMDKTEIETAVKGVIGELEADCLKDMGRTMSCLRERYAGAMDFSKASGIAKSLLG